MSILEDIALPSLDKVYVLDLEAILNHRGIDVAHCKRFDVISFLDDDGSIEDMPRIVLSADGRGVRVRLDIYNTVSDYVNRINAKTVFVDDYPTYKTAIVKAGDILEEMKNG